MLQQDILMMGSSVIRQDDPNSALSLATGASKILPTLDNTCCVLQENALAREQILNLHMGGRGRVSHMKKVGDACWKI